MIGNTPNGERRAMPKLFITPSATPEPIHMSEKGALAGTGAALAIQCTHVSPDIVSVT